MGKLAARTQRITTPELLATPAEPLPRVAQDVGPPEGSLSLADMTAKMRLLAEQCPLTAPELEAMYTAQVAEVTAEALRLGAALERANADPRLEDRDSPLWEKYYQLDTRYRYVQDTLSLLKKCGHVIVCPNCKDEALSLRGLLTGEGAVSWSRYCLECNKESLKAEAERLLARHRSRVVK